MSEPEFVAALKTGGAVRLRQLLEPRRMKAEKQLERFFRLTGQDVFEAGPTPVVLKGVAAGKTLHYIKAQKDELSLGLFFPLLAPVLWSCSPKSIFTAKFPLFRIIHLLS